MNYNMICTDIDGTLLDKNRELSSATINSIKGLDEIIETILISSRMPSAMYHLQDDLNIKDKPIIAYNGGLILDQDKVLSSTTISNTVLEAAIAFLESTSIHLSLYQNDEWYVPEFDYWANREANNTKVKPQRQKLEDTLALFKQRNLGAHKIMCMGDANEIDYLYRKLEDLHANEIILYRSKDTYIEIAHRSISKLTAINTLIKNKYPETKLNNIVAFGDNYNDIEMLSKVGLGVAVENSKQAVKQAANDITDSNFNDGVAKYISKLF